MLVKAVFSGPKTRTARMLSETPSGGFKPFCTPICVAMPMRGGICLATTGLSSGFFAWKVV